MALKPTDEQACSIFLQALVGMQPKADNESLKRAIRDVERRYVIKLTHEQTERVKEHYRRQHQPPK